MNHIGNRWIRGNPTNNNDIKYESGNNQDPYVSISDYSNKNIEVKIQQFAFLQIQ